MFRQHAVHDVLVDVDPERLRDDARNRWTTEPRIARDARQNSVPARCTFDSRTNTRHDPRMLELIVLTGRALALVCHGHHELVLENVALRQQLRAIKRTIKRPHLRRRDRVFWIVLARI